MQIHMFIQQSGMISQLKIEDYLIRRLQGMVISSDFAVPILIKHMKGYVLDGLQLGISSQKFPAGIDQLTEVKVIHNGTVRYKRPDVKDNQQGSAAIDRFQGQVRRTYLANLRRKDQIYFGTAEGARGPIKSFSDI